MAFPSMKEIGYKHGGPITLNYKARDSFYSDKTPQTTTFKDEYAARVWLNSFSCRDARWKPESISINRRGC